MLFGSGESEQNNEMNAYSHNYRGSIRDTGHTSPIPHVTANTTSLAPQTSRQEGGLEPIEIEDRTVSATPEMSEMRKCNWYLVYIPGDASPYVAYPFGLHEG